MVKRLLLLAALFSAAPAWASFQACGSCSFICHTPQGDFPGSGSRCLTFSSEAECLAAVSTPCDAYTQPCEGIGFPTGVVCTFIPDGTNTGGGSPSRPFVIPGAEFVPEGALIGRSFLEHLAGGFHELGDVAVAGPAYGQPFYTSHYSLSTHDWIDAANRRFNAYLQHNQRLKERFDAERAKRKLAKLPAISPFGDNRARETTKEFENEFMRQTMARGGNGGGGMGGGGPPAAAAGGEPPRRPGLPERTPVESLKKGQLTDKEWNDMRDLAQKLGKDLVLSGSLTETDLGLERRYAAMNDPALKEKFPEFRQDKLNSGLVDKGDEKGDVDLWEGSNLSKADLAEIKKVFPKFEKVDTGYKKEDYPTLSKFGDKDEGPGAIIFKANGTVERIEASWQRKKW